MKTRSILFVPREQAWLEQNYDGKIGDIKTLQERMGAKKMVTIDFTEKFDLGNGDQLYVLPGHGTAGSGTVHWAGANNWLAAETVAQLTAERFPDCTDVSIKIYSCHSSEGGYNSFANRFARAFRPVGGTYEVTIFGYRGSVTPTALQLNTANVEGSKGFEVYKTVKNLQTGQPLYAFPKDFTGPTASVVVGAKHRWSKVAQPVFASRASEAREKVAWLKGVKGTVTQRWGV
jgi:hypothetical protein